MRAVCIDNLNPKVNLTEGKEYEVLERNPFLKVEGHYLIMDDTNEARYFANNRFKIVEGEK